MIEILYFAWLRERIGIPRETIDSQAATVGDLITELRAKDPRYALAFSDLSALRAAVNQELVEFDAPLNGAKEVAFFPPMTGG